MKIHKIVLILTLTGTKALAQETIPFSTETWTFQSDEYKLEEHNGRPAVWIKNNQMVVNNANFKNGTIEFDVAFQDARAFVGINFRITDERNCEQFYLRPHQSGNPDANQYCPVFNGLSSWQLYTGEGYSAPTSYLFNNWVHCKLVVNDTKMAVYISDMRKPAFVARLHHQPAFGDISLYCATGEAWFSEFKMDKGDSGEITGLPLLRSPEPGTVLQWQISTPFPETNLHNTLQIKSSNIDSLKWSNHTAEPTGTLNIASASAWTRDNNTAFAKLVLNSDKAQIKKMTYGFSDRVKVFLNGQIIAGGQDGFQSRDYRFLGTIGYFDDVYLNLKKGRNEILIAVSENFGGWGIQAKIEDQEGIQFLQLKL